MSGGYTSEQVEAIAGWLSEGLTASQIVSVFCRTFGEDRSRNAIIGIVHRNKRLAAIGLAGRGERSEKQKVAAARHKKVERRQVRRAVLPPVPVVAPQPPKRVDAAAKILADLAWSECRWAVNDAAPTARIAPSMRTARAPAMAVQVCSPTRDRGRRDGE